MDESDRSIEMEYLLCTFSIVVSIVWSKIKVSVSVISMFFKLWKSNHFLTQFVR